MKTSRSRILPPAYLLFGLIAMAAAHLVLPDLRWIRGVWRLAGAPMILGGAWLALAADALFKCHGTEIKPFRPSRMVVVDGPYRFSRHPMYLGFLGLLGGAAILAGTLGPLIVLGLMACLFRTHFVVPEERHMEEQFGQEYRDYQRRVRRWL